MAMPTVQMPLTEVTPPRYDRAQDLDSEFVWQQHLSQSGDINPGQLVACYLKIATEGRSSFHRNENETTRH